MKRTFLFYRIWALLAFTCLFTSCSNDDDESNSTSMVEMYDMLMFVTNDANEDLVENSDKYYHTIEKFHFDSWKIYLDEKLIQTGDNNNKYNERSVNYLQHNTVDRKNIHLASSMAIQQRIDDYTKKHVAEYVVTSASLFGDTEKHTIRMEFRLGELQYPEYAISVDGIEQEVLYPVHWKVKFPQSQYADLITPYFVLNVDAL